MLLCLIQFVGFTTGLRADAPRVWETGPGYRSAPLAIAPGGTNGFARVFPTASGNWNQPGGGGAARAFLWFGVWKHATSTVGANFMGTGDINGGSGGLIVNNQAWTFAAGTLAVFVG